MQRNISKSKNMNKGINAHSVKVKNSIEIESFI